MHNSLAGRTAFAVPEAATATVLNICEPGVRLSAVGSPLVFFAICNDMFQFALYLHLDHIYSLPTTYLPYENATNM